MRNLLIKTVVLLECLLAGSFAYAEDNAAAGKTVFENQCASCHTTVVGKDGFGPSQAGDLFRLFDAGQKHRLFENIAAAMHGVPEEIKRRQTALFAKCDPAYGAGVAKALKLEPLGRVFPSPPM